MDIICRDIHIMLKRTDVGKLSRAQITIVLNENNNYWKSPAIQHAIAQLFMREKVFYFSKFWYMKWAMGCMLYWRVAYGQYEPYEPILLRS